ncbi:hypothetical protein K8I31_06310 [bacterium]|nr:hypothetical protein [bacterium]
MICVNRTNQSAVLLIIVLAALFISFSSDAADLEVTLGLKDPSQTEFIVGEPISFSVALKNNSDQPITIVQPLDGSSESMRYPVYQMRLQEPFRIPTSGHMMCGNTNNLLITDFVTIPAHESYVPNEWLQTVFTPYLAGIHEYSILVKFDAPKEQYEGYMGEFHWTDELNALIAKVPKIDIQSATLSINVTSNQQTGDPSVHSLMGMPKAEIIRMFFNDQPEEFDNSFAWYQSLPDSMEGCVRVSLSNISCSPVVHLSENNIVDGVFVSSLNAREPLIENDWLMWMRGNDEDAPVKIEKENGVVQEIQVGYFAQQKAQSVAKDWTLFK